MIREPRAREPLETLRLALGAAERVGISRIADVTAFGVPGIPVFQAVRPFAKSLTVSQGKGLSRSAAMVAALLESTELWAAERLASSGTTARLQVLPEPDRALWSGNRHELAVSLDPLRERPWLEGIDLATNKKRAVPVELLSLDFTLPRGEYPPTSNGLAFGNTRDEALASGVAELIEHHCSSLFTTTSARERLASQICIASIEDPVLLRLVRRIDRAGFHLRSWSVGQEAGIAVIDCLLTEKQRQLDNMSPAIGSGCHPDKRIAFLRALLEAVQSRATLFAGARDDIDPAAYIRGKKHEVDIVFSSLAFGDGPLQWKDLPTFESDECAGRLEYLLEKANCLGGAVVAYEHQHPIEGLSLFHCLCPGLQDIARERSQAAPASPRVLQIAPATRSDRRPVLFAGPSIFGLDVCTDIELRPPARCGELLSLLTDPPDTVGLIDGAFRTSRTVWHNEIIALLAKGCRVIGGASLGAIRAAELDGQGMEGVGAIYAAYAEDALRRDDAVLVLHAPAELDFQPLTISLVDAECILAQFDLPRRDLRMMLRIVRTTDYTLRTWQVCLDNFKERTGRAFPVTLETLCGADSLKQADAARVIKAMSSPPARPAAVGRPPPPTVYWRSLLTTLEPAFAAIPP